MFQVDEGIRVRCDCHWQNNPSGKLTAILVHGLEGSSSSQYVIGTANKAWDEGMNVVRMNVRNCGGTEALGESLYHSGLSADLDVVAKELIASEGLKAVALAGFSMGGNMVLKLAGEWGESAPPQIRGVAAVCPGMDLAASSAALHRGANRIYELRFLISLWGSVRRKTRLYPRQFEPPRLRCLRSMRDFDDEVTSRYCGFSCADDYYARASATPFVPRIKVPTLVIHAEDDPFVHLLPESRSALKANPHVTLIVTEHGGHCGFLGEPDGYDGRWAERKIIEFFRNLRPSAT